MFDFIYTLRSLLRNRGYVSLVIVIVAGGLAVAMALYSFVENIWFKPLPFDNGDRFITFKSYDNNSSLEPISAVDEFIAQYLSETTSSFDTINITRTRLNAVLSEGDATESYNAAQISADLLAAAQVAPKLGRLLTRDDEIAGAQNVALIGDRVWLNSFEGQQDIIGRETTINGQPYTIVGVMPREFRFPFAHDVWLPLKLGARSEPGKAPLTSLLGVLKDGVSIEQANIDVAKNMATLAEDHPEYYSTQVVYAIPYTHTVLNNFNIIYAMIAAVVAIVLLMCVNVGNLLLVRANENLNDLAIQKALGASIWKLMQSSLRESFLICLTGGLLGLGLSVLVIHFVGLMLALFYGGEIFQPFWWEFHLTTSSVIAAIICLGCTWLLGSSFPMWQLFRSKDEPLMGKSTSKSLVGAQSPRVIRYLVGFEVTLSIALLIVSGSLAAAIQLAVNSDYGAATENYLSANISLNTQDYGDIDARLQYYTTLQTELNALPAIEHTSFTTALPGSLAPQIPFNVEDRNLRDTTGGFPKQGVVWVSDNYFNVMDVPVLAGRSFDGGDQRDSLPVVVIDDIFAAQMWPGESAVGKRLLIEPGAKQEWLMVIGVIQHIVQSRPLQGVKNVSTLYRPLSQSSPRQLSLVAPTTVVPIALVQSVKRVSTQVDRRIALTNVQSLEHGLIRNMSGWQLISSLFAMAAAIAFIMSMCGIYGVMSRAVTQRTQEMGVRRALGLTNLGVTKQFLLSASVYLLIGLVVGGTVGLLGLNVFAEVLAEILNRLPIVLATTTFGVTLTIYLATVVPSRKIAQLEPGDALRYE